jgi:aminomethyltransferase
MIDSGFRADSDALRFAKGVSAFANMDVELGEPDVSPLQIQGPKSKPLVRKLFGDEVADQPYYWHKFVTSRDGNFGWSLTRVGRRSRLRWFTPARDGYF